MSVNAARMSACATSLPQQPAPKLRYRNNSPRCGARTHACRVATLGDTRLTSQVAASLAHPNISLSAAAHESHTVGYSVLSPTAVERFQQRSHFVPSAFSTVARKTSPGASVTCETMKMDGSWGSYSFNR